MLCQWKSELAADGAKVMNRPLLVQCCGHLGVDFEIEHKALADDVGQGVGKEVPVP
jgi:hypothetical protein